MNFLSSTEWLALGRNTKINKTYRLSSSSTQAIRQIIRKLEDNVSNGRVEACREVCWPTGLPENASLKRWHSGVGLKHEQKSQAGEEWRVPRQRGEHVRRFQAIFCGIEISEVCLVGGGMYGSIRRGAWQKPCLVRSYFSAMPSKIWAFVHGQEIFITYLRQRRDMF